MGASGAGKTTIVRLLMRFYDPDAGAVYVGGHDLRALHPEDLHRQNRGGEPGHLPLPRHGRGQPAPGQARRERGGARGGGARRQCPRVHRASASRVRHGGGRAGHSPLRRTAPTCRDRPGPAARCADTHPRRGALGSGCAERGSDPGGARPSHAGTHQSHLRSPAVERDRGGSHSRPRRHRHRGIRHASRADGNARPLPCADVDPGRGRRERGRGDSGRGRRTGCRGSRSPVVLRGEPGAHGRDHQGAGDGPGSPRFASSALTSCRGRESSS